MLLPFHCFLTGYLKRCCLLGDMYKWRCCLSEDIHKWRRMSQQRLSVLSQHHLDGPCASVCTGRMAPWLASGERLERSGESWWRDHLLWKGGWAGPQHRGCTGGEAGRGKPLSVAALKWEGGLRWADFSCEEQKARLSLHQLYLFLSWRDGAVSSRSPEELPLTAYRSVSFVFQVHRGRRSSLCVKQLSGTMLPVCTSRFRSASVLYNQICIST